VKKTKTIFLTMMVVVGLAIYSFLSEIPSQQKGAILRQDILQTKDRKNDQYSEVSDRHAHDQSLPVLKTSIDPIQPPSSQEGESEYTSWDPGEIQEEIIEIDREITEKELIGKANDSSLSEEERDRLDILLKKRDFLSIARMRKLLQD
jgi:hypothetical protein